MALDPSGHPEENALTALVQQQKDIGWEFFTLGFWSTGWRSIQANHFQQHGKITIESWMRKAHCAQWEYVWSLWDHRNAIVKGRTAAELKEHQRLELMEQVKEQLENIQVGGCASDLRDPAILAKSVRTQR